MKQKIVLSNELRVDKGSLWQKAMLTLEALAFWIFHGGNSTFMNSFDKKKSLFHSLFHWRSTTVSRETRNPFWWNVFKFGSRFENWRTKFNSSRSQWIFLIKQWHKGDWVNSVKSYMKYFIYWTAELESSKPWSFSRDLAKPVRRFQPRLILDFFRLLSTIA